MSLGLLAELSLSWSTLCTSMVHVFFTGVSETSVVKNNDMAKNLDFGRYVQEMLPKYVQQSQVTHG